MPKFSDMKDISMPQKFILDCFQYSLTGRLGHGIVHNLNGPLQILSMHLEMLKMDIMKFCGHNESHSGEASDTMSRMNERLEQINDVVIRLESMIQILGYRGEDQSGDKQPMPVDMCMFIKDFLEFWNADLYFKHRVDKSVSLPDATIFQIIDESGVLAIMDGIMAGFLHCIKEVEGSRFSVELSQGDEGNCVISFGHSGKPVSTEICDAVTALRQQYMTTKDSQLLQCHHINNHPEILMALLLAAFRSVEIGWEFELEPMSAVITSPAH